MVRNQIEVARLARGCSRQRTQSALENPSNSGLRTGARRRALGDDIQHAVAMQSTPARCGRDEEIRPWARREDKTTTTPDRLKVPFPA